MQVSDEEFATATGRSSELTVLERVDPNNFHEGHRPSLISAPIDAYPNCWRDDGTCVACCPLAINSTSKIRISIWSLSR